MRVAELTFPFGYERWATGRLLAAADGLSEDQWVAVRATGAAGVDYAVDVLPRDPQ